MEETDNKIMSFVFILQMVMIKWRKNEAETGGCQGDYQSLSRYHGDI